MIRSFHYGWTAMTQTTMGTMTAPIPATATEIVLQDQVDPQEKIARKSKNPSKGTGKGMIPRFSRIAMAVDLIPTGVAAALITAAERLITTAWRRYHRTPGGEFHTLEEKLHKLDRRISEVESSVTDFRRKAQEDDLDYRLIQLEIIARRHGWEIGRRAASSGDMG